MSINNDLRALLPEEISGVLKLQGEKSYRGKQIFRWLQENCIRSYTNMTDIPVKLQEILEDNWPIIPLNLIQEQVSKDGTRKYLFKLSDGHFIETVLMTHLEATGHYRHSLCLSTQVGCAMGCDFCATGQGGFFRNLSTGEIIGQVLDVIYDRRKTVPDFNINNLVYMGMGEPLLNYDSVIKSIRILNHPLGQKIGIRRITVSTCGIPKQIRRLAEEGLDIVLALSLHSPETQLRSQLMPVNRQYPLDEVIAACRDYAKASGRRITFEYIMIKDLNIFNQQATALCKLLKGIPCNVNLIPINEGNHCYKKPSRKNQEDFRTRLKEGGLEAVIREEKGADIAGACGQLAGQSVQGE